MSLVLKPRSKKRFVRQSIPAKQAPTRCGGDHRANVAADVFEKSRRQVVALWPWLYRSMQQSAPLVPPFLQVALISSLPPVFAITTILPHRDPHPIDCAFLSRSVCATPPSKQSLLLDVAAVSISSTALCCKLHFKSDTNSLASPVTLRARMR